MNGVTVAHVVAVVVGGGAGSLLRFLAQRAGAAVFGAVPVATVVVNIVGSFVMGVLASLFVRHGSAQSDVWRTFALTGVLGGFTTFSAFSLDAANLWHDRGAVVAAAYVGASVVGALVAVAVGVAVAR